MTKKNPSPLILFFFPSPFRGEGQGEGVFSLKNTFPPKISLLKKSPSLCPSRKGREKEINEREVRVRVDNKGEKKIPPYEPPKNRKNKR